MSKKKKIILLTTMMLLLVVTAVCNFAFTGRTLTDANSSVLTNANYFSQRRTERASSRNETILQLDAIIDKADASSSAKEDALKMKQLLAKNTEKELLLESLIKSQGFEDAVVIIGVETENINVVVKDDNLTDDESIVIYSLVKAETAKSPEKVKIIPIS